MFGLGHLDTMARSNNPTIVIAGGAWQPSSGYNLLVAKLCSQGYTTIAPSLPSIGGTTTPLPGLAEDVQAIRTVLKNLVDEGKDVILLCHSYGGVVGSCAVEGLDTATRKKNVLPGGVSKVIYMSAFMLPKGKSLVEMLGGQPLPWMEIQGDKCFAIQSLMPQVAFNDLPEDEGVMYCQGLTHSTASCFASPSTFEPWSNGIPCAYIYLTEDNAIHLPIQESLAAQLGPNAETHTLKSGHCAYVSAPNQLVRVIQKAVGAPKRGNGFRLRGWKWSHYWVGRGASASSRVS